VKIAYASSEVDRADGKSPERKWAWVRWWRAWAFWMWVGPKVLDAVDWARRRRRRDRECSDKVWRTTPALLYEATLNTTFICRGSETHQDGTDLRMTKSMNHLPHLQHMPKVP
jgi:hypothetical protein